MGIFVKDKEFYRSFWVLTITIALQNVIVLAVGLADNIMLGNYTQDALSGVSLANQIQFLLQMIISGIGEGMMVFAARSWGEKDIPAIWKITSIGMWLGLFSSVAFGLVMGFFPTQMLGLLSDEASVVAEGAKYLRIIAFTYPMSAISMVLLTMLRSVEIVRIGLYINLSTLFVNIFLNYALIFGQFGFPCMGTEGAAVATLVSRLLEMLIAIVYVLWVEKRVKLKLRAFRKVDLKLLKAYFRYGSPVMVSGIMWGIAMTVQTAILGHLGGDPIAANSIATTVFQIMTVVSYASASSTTVIIGKAIGAGDVGKVKRYAKTMQVLFLCIGVVTGLCLFLCKDLVIGMYQVTPEAARLADQFMLVLSITAIGTSYQMPALTGVVRAGGDTSFVLINDLVFQWLIVLPAAFLSAFVFQLPPLFTFICLKSDQVLKCLVAVIKVNRYRWIKKIS